ncbi:MAG: aminotransferase class III-fold pyridoxal phosphate-dependent enzyme [Pseudomonadota bacterium]
MNKIHTQAEWMERAKQVLPGGTYGNFDAAITVREAKGSRVWDEDGNEYVDFLIGSGPMLIGHGHPEVLEVVFEQLPRGMTFFANNAYGIELAEEICRAVPCAEQLRYLSTGGEADMYAMRIARAYTRRNKILKFEGGYHGMSSEAQMSLAPSVQVDFPRAVPDSAGIPESVRAEMLIAPYNDIDYVNNLLEEQGQDVAAIIVEPLQRIIPPESGYLQALRDACDRHGILLIYDEVVTGFRLAYGGAQEAYGVAPDLCTLGKIIGGGFPLAAVAGRRDILDHFDKGVVGSDRWLMMLGTLSGNPVACVAGLKTMEILRREGAYDTLLKNGERVQNIARDALNKQDIAHEIVGHPSLFETVMASGPMKDYRDVQRGDAEQSAVLNAALRQEGILKSPAKIYPSMALTEDDFGVIEKAFERGAAALSA